jgi:hypothetical protein
MSSEELIKKDTINTSTGMPDISDDEKFAA